MILKYLNIKLHPLRHTDIEFLRNVRNENRNKLVHSEEISETQQKAWFDSLNYETSQYFTISKSGKSLGFIYAKLEMQKKAVETGLLMSTENINSSYAALAALLLSYYYLNLLKYSCLRATVHVLNEEAKQFNEKFGFSETLRDEEFIYFECQKNDFLKVNKEIIQRLDLDKKLIILEMDEND